MCDVVKYAISGRFQLALRPARPLNYWISVIV
jgi:hypothetical protein